MEDRDKVIGGLILLLLLGFLAMAIAGAGEDDGLGPGGQGLCSSNPLLAIAKR